MLDEFTPTLKIVPVYESVRLLLVIVLSQQFAIFFIQLCRDKKLNKYRKAFYSWKQKRCTVKMAP